MPKTSNGVKVLPAVVVSDGRTQSKDGRTWASAKVKLRTGQEVYVNANDPEDHAGRAVLALGQGEHIRVSVTKKGNRTFYDLFTTGAGASGDPNQTDAFPEDDEPAPSDRPTNDRSAANPLADGLARGVHQEMAQIRLLTADVMNEMKAQGKEKPDPLAALICAQAIWQKRQNEALFWDHDIPSAMRA